MRLFSNRSKRTSECGKNISDTLGCASCATFLFLPHFDVIWDLLLNRRTATWNLFVKQRESDLTVKKLEFNRIFFISFGSCAGFSMNLTFERGKLRPNSTDPVVSRVQDGKYAHWYTLKNNRPLCLLSPSIQEYHWHFAQDPTAEIKRWGPYLSLLVCSVSESWSRHHLVSRQSCSIAPKIHNLPHSCLNFPAKIMIKVWLQIMIL